MKRFIATLNDGSFINIPADSMKLENDALLVSDGNELVAYVDLSCTLCAHISERSGKDEES